MSATRPAAVGAVVVLAAGEGTRMRSATPKVLHEVADRSLLLHVLAAAAHLEPAHLVVVVGHGRAAVRDHLAEYAPKATIVVQEEQRGTGHAVRCALASLPDLDGPLVVTAGDTPLLRGESLAALVAAHLGAGDAATVLSARLADPAGYGRVVRDASGAVTAIVEDKDASDGERTIDEVNSGTYVFQTAALRSGLDRLSTDNSQGEEYLPDVLAILRADGRGIGAVLAPEPAEILGVNDRVQLAAAGALLRDRILEQWMRAGVTVVDPATTWIGADVTLEPDTVLLPGTQLHGSTSVAAGARIGPSCTLLDTVVGARAVLRRTVAEGAVIGADAVVGPYAYLRQGTRLGRGSKVGTYVETKNAQLGAGAKVPHLSYVGDATIGDHTNIGAATVFVNYDGVAKHRTTIGRHARTGADNMFVAPVNVGDGAYTAAGSVITEDVPPGAMAVARGRQHNIEGWVARSRPGTPSAVAAAQAGQQQQGSSGPGEQVEEQP